MIGQLDLFNECKELIKNDKFPRFVILVGEEGSGRKTFSHLIARELKAQEAIVSIKTDSIREMITNAYKVNMKTLYVIPNADTMSANAKNAILKVTEEPPNNAYFIMILEDISNTLNTLISRGTVINMQPYTPFQILKYAETVNGSLSEKEKDIIRDLCVVPGQAQLMIADNILEFFGYVEKVVDHIATVSSANCFKIADKVDLKGDGNGYDLKMFWRIFIKICTDSIYDDIDRYSQGITITSRYLQALRIKSNNKNMLMDMWILDIRKAWMK